MYDLLSSGSSIRSQKVLAFIDTSYSLKTGQDPIGDEKKHSFQPRRRASQKNGESPLQSSKKSRILKDGRTSFAEMWESKTSSAKRDT
jgi:hypothetical protein